MNISTSECSSGCESGWTMYLDQSSNSAEKSQKSGGEGCRFKSANVEEEYDEDEDEDLSMVSDATSGPPGPPHFQEDEYLFDETRYNCYVAQPNNIIEEKKKNKMKVKEERSKLHKSNLDDTASSPIKKHTALPPSGASMEQHTLGFSQGFSATHFKGKSALHKHIGIFHSSVSGKPASGAPGDLQGRKWE